MDLLKSLMGGSPVKSASKSKSSKSAKSATKPKPVKKVKVTKTKKVKNVKKTSKYVKTEMTHKDRCGKVRTVYTYNGVKYVKKRSARTGKFAYYRVKAKSA